jgi:hypothetical protein
MPSRIPFSCGDFYDVPRMIQFELGGRWYFLRSYFLAERDDYDDGYEVYLLPHKTAAEIEANPIYWIELSGAVHLGRIPVADVGLDASRRQHLDGEVFERWLSSRTTQDMTEPT